MPSARQLQARVHPLLALGPPASLRQHLRAAGEPRKQPGGTLPEGCPAGHCSAPGAARPGCGRSAARCPPRPGSAPPAPAAAQPAPAGGVRPHSSRRAAGRAGPNCGRALRQAFAGPGTPLLGRQPSAAWRCTGLHAHRTCACWCTEREASARYASSAAATCAPVLSWSAGPGPQQGGCRLCRARAAG